MVVSTGTVDAYQVVPDSWKVFVNLNSMLLEVVGRTDAAQHQELRRTKGASAENDLMFRCHSLSLRTRSGDNLYTLGEWSCVSMSNEHLFDYGIGQDMQVLALLDKLGRKEGMVSGVSELVFVAGKVQLATTKRRVLRRIDIVDEWETNLFATLNDPDRTLVKYFLR